MTTRRHAEIAGTGFAGLAAAVALLQRNWSVRVHERNASVRAEGFGIAVHANGLRVLETLGVLPEVAQASMLTSETVTHDADGRLLMSVPSNGRTRRVSRHLLVRALAARAEALGAEIVTGSEAAAAEPSGVLITADSRRHGADLVVAADGVNSRLRDGLGFVRRRRTLRDGAMRLVVPRFGGPNESGSAPTTEHWSGTRRVIVSDCSPQETYVALSSLGSDAAGCAVPLDLASWQRAFPRLADFLAHLAAQASWDEVRWAQFQVMHLKAWSAGRVALVGDAAHAMPPNLGQGGGCAMMNALSLAHAVSGDRPVEESLLAWERAERPMTEHTQRLALLYSLTTFWPERLRGLAFRATGRIGWLSDYYQRTARYVPPGAGEPPILPSGAA